MKIKKNPSQAFLRKRFDYHQDGYLIFKQRSVSDFSSCKNPSRACLAWNGKFAGKLVGLTNPKIYSCVSLTIDDVRNIYYVHRLIYSWHNDYLPQNMEVDHIDMDKSNNSIENLRMATRSQNRFNIGLRMDSTTKMKGISLKRNLWMARIRVNGKRYEKSSKNLNVVKEWLYMMREEKHMKFANHGYDIDIK